MTQRNEQDITALMCATMSGPVPLVKLLVAKVRRELGVLLPHQLGKLLPAVKASSASSLLC